MDDRSPHMEMTVTLPRETGSVPVMRHLAGQTMDALGVVRSDVDDVQLAITEACANVVAHAVDTDTYEVKVDLGSHRCTITVVDRGTGFDSSTVVDDVHEHAERGRGLRLMQTLMDATAFESVPLAGSVVHMVKELHYDESHPLHRRDAPEPEAL